ncbi:hypothetical protein SteCoe_25116 [Stentor coeruleus]|uniref:Uncharacterized protein n=1 Tax=Stentor coeruleus TaxID=5963 RepID=A0A1R2BFW3_9CILI|nr:hypothetical protein SteCoe_25116 [Stentor coeruleus]
MDSKTKEEILKEIEKEEKLCKEIYEQLMKNRTKYEEQIRILQEQKLSVSLQSMKNISSSKNPKTHSKQTTDRGVSPIHVIENKENTRFPKGNIISSSSRNDKTSLKSNKNSNNIRIPLGNIPVNIPYDALSSRKNPLDSLRNTTDRNELISSFDSLQYSEDISFL